MLSAVDAMRKPSQAPAELCVVRVHHHRRRLRAQHREHPICASPRGKGVAECEARRDEPHDLLVTSSIIAMNAIDRVSAASRLRVATREQRVQVFADTVHFSPVLAILTRQLQ